jgi:hypothetical protein
MLILHKRKTQIEDHEILEMEMTSERDRPNVRN